MNRFLILFSLGVSLFGLSAKAELSLHFNSDDHYYPHHYPYYGQAWGYYPAYERPPYYGLRAYSPILQQVPVFDPVPAYPAAVPGYVAYPQILPRSTLVSTAYATTEPLTQLEAFIAQLSAMKIARVRQGLVSLTEQLTQQIANDTRTATQLTNGQIAVQQYQVQGIQSSILVSGTASANGRDFPYQATLNLESDQAPAVHVTHDLQSALPLQSGNADEVQVPKTLGDHPWYPATQSTSH